MRFDEYGLDVAKIVAMVNGEPMVCGEVYLYDNGQAVVYDDLWGDAPRYCDSHGDAMKVIVTRIVTDCELDWR